MSSPSSGEEPDNEGDRAWGDMGTMHDLLQWHCVSQHSLYQSWVYCPTRPHSWQESKKDGMRRAEDYRWQWLSWVTVEGELGRPGHLFPLDSARGQAFRSSRCHLPPRLSIPRIIRLRGWKALVLEGCGRGRVFQAFAFRRVGEWCSVA